MSYKAPGQKPAHYAWSKAWFRALPEQDLTVLVQLAEQQIERRAPMSKRSEKLALRTLAERDRRQAEGNPQTAVAVMTQ